MVNVMQCHINGGAGICPSRVYDPIHSGRSLWLEHPDISKGRGSGVDDVQSHTEGFVLFGSLLFFFPRIFLVICRYVIYVFYKESGDSRWRHPKLYNLWHQIYLSSCFQGWKFEWIWYHLTICNDWKLNWMYVLRYIYIYFLVSMFDRHT